MRLLICGPRDMCEYTYLCATMALFHFDATKPSLVIEGETTEVDTVAKEWASQRDVPHRSFPADWDRYGRLAGPIRNRQMLEEGTPDLVLAFQPLGDTTPGTQNMIKQARKAHVPVLVCIV